MTRLTICLLAIVLGFTPLVWAAGKSDADRSKTATFTGSVDTISAVRGKLTVKTLFRSKTFIVSPECEIIARRKPTATLRDIQPRDDVTVTYREHEGKLIAERIAQRGAGSDAREKAREQEHLQRLLTPSPSERPAW